MRQLFLTSLLMFLQTAHALDAFETQVYDAGINEIGKRSLEVHLNHVVDGKKDPEYPEQIANNHLSHMTFELALGLTEFWEMGAYLQSAITTDTQLKYAGVKVRSKFVVPKSVSGNYQLGINFEVSNVPKAFEPIQYSAEIRPIFGYQWEHVLFLVNPILGFNLFEQLDSNPTFAPATKIVFETHQGYGLGAEYYVDFGSTKQMDSLNRAEQYVYLVYDKLEGPFELNIGIGRGLTAASNSYALKTIIGTEF